MKSKSEVRHIFPIFYQYVLTQFSAKIKVIRSDNGVEFLFPSFYSSHGIIHQVSCVETPEQNVVVERKHQQILNIARILKFSVIHSYEFLRLLCFASCLLD